MQLPKDDWLVLDALRKKRNVNDYAGELIDPESVRECITRANALHAKTEEWLHAHHPQLLQQSSIYARVEAQRMARRQSQNITEFRVNLLNLRGQSPKEKPLRLRRLKIRPV